MKMTFQPKTRQSKNEVSRWKKSFSSKKSKRKKKTFSLRVVSRRQMSAEQGIYLPFFTFKI